MTINRTIATSTLIALLAISVFARPSLSGGVSTVEITVSAGDRAVPDGPTCLPPHPAVQPDRVYRLEFKGLGVPSRFAQADHEGRLWWWTSPMEPGQQFTYELRLLQSGKRLAGIFVTDADADEGKIRVSLDDNPFTTLNFKKDEPKVYLYPVIGPTGKPVTRDYPMKDNPIEKNNGRQDHHHHRSIWCAHGDVRSPGFEGSANYWHETKEPEKQDLQKLKRIVRTVSGPVFGQIEAEIEWVTHTGVRQFTEFRTYTFFAKPEARIIDVRNVFKFTDGDVTFGDTKEGGILAIRTAVSMDERGVEKPTRMHGQMTNIHGQKGEKECWGKAAAWCDYVGPVNGKTVGVAVLDHPKNFRHPTRWHIRGYGLYTANPFGLSHFTRDKKQNGSHTFKKGETAEFNYRVLIHEDDTAAARVVDQFKLYRDPPEVACSTRQDR